MSTSIEPTIPVASETVPEVEPAVSSTAPATEAEVVPSCNDGAAKQVAIPLPPAPAADTATPAQPAVFDAAFMESVAHEVLWDVSLGISSFLRCSRPAGR